MKETKRQRKSKKHSATCNMIHTREDHLPLLHFKCGLILTSEKVTTEVDLNMLCLFCDPVFPENIFYYFTAILHLSDSVYFRILLDKKSWQQISRQVMRFFCISDIRTLKKIFRRNCQCKIKFKKIKKKSSFYIFRK